MNFPFSCTKLDLSKSDQGNHPDISTKKKYMVKYNGEWFIGTFSRQWYGLNFSFPYNVTVGFQFNAPNYNASTWEEVWEINE